MRGLSAKIAFAGVLTAALLSSCAAISGLDSFGVVDCSGEGCIEGGPGADAQVADTSAADTSVVIEDAEVGPPKCDPLTDPACLALPAGWSLVAFASMLDGGAPPACPTGLDVASDGGENPMPRANACECKDCTVTTQTSCTGTPTRLVGTSTCNVPGSLLSNNPAGTCLNDLYMGDRTGTREQVALAAPTGGACTAAAAIVHKDFVDFAKPSRVCDSTTRCSGSTCDARVPAPFLACLASPPSAVDDDRPCPKDFPKKHLVGTGATFNCGPACGCTVSKSCTGTLNYYTDGACTAGVVTIPADNTCRQPAFAGSYNSYKVVTTPTTTCAATGTPNAMGAKVTPARTVCCR